LNTLEGKHEVGPRQDRRGGSCGPAITLKTRPKQTSPTNKEKGRVSFILGNLRWGRPGRRKEHGERLCSREDRTKTKGHPIDLKTNVREE